MADENFEETIKRGFGAFAERVPLDPVENLKFRRQLRKLCIDDEKYRERVFRACQSDPLFFFNSLCFGYEPRPKLVNGKLAPMVFPFIAWEHQVPMMKQFHAHLGLCDIGVEKSRGEGMSWTLVLFATWDWIFNDMRAIGLVSKDENAVDNPDDPDSLMWKIDFLISKMPRWLVGDKDTDWKRDRGKHVLKNLRNGSTITGYAATGNVASGGRKSWFGMDELAKFPRGPDAEAMASTQHVTNCRAVVSTPKGADGAYYKLMHEPSSMIRERLHWTMNPTRNRGMYTLVDGRAVAVDPVNNPLTPEYRDMTPEVLERLENLRKKGYTLEGKPRSPWYDNECDRAGATPQNIAQELDIDYGGSAFRIFGNDCLERVKGTTKPEVLRGHLDFSKEDLDPTFDELPNGPLRVWMPLDQRRLPPNHAFVVGCDVCTGMGGSYTSNSSLIVIDAVTKEEVAEFVSNTMPPGDFADFAIAVCKWLNNAFLAWEHNGPGNGFTKRVIERGYSNVYYRTDQSVRKKTKTKKLGWWTSTDSKEVMFESLRMSLRSGELTVRSMELAEELGQYIRKGPQIFNALSMNASEDSQGSSHGDRVIGLGVAWMAMKDHPGLVQEQQRMNAKKRPPAGSLAEREEEYKQSLVTRNDGWDSRSLGDLARGR